MSKVPASRSVYRGQSRRGRIGEGPGRPIAQGEQYLDAEAPLDGDADLLDAIRPWMSLDSDPADHQALGDRLEAWSFFTYRGRQLVARLVAAGIYDRRAAYFAHGRLWPLEVPPGFDPGLHLGHSEAFEAPWRDDDPGRRVPEPEPALSGVERVGVEADTAAFFLAHLLQSCVRQRPLVVVAPLSDFAEGSPFYSLLSFARGALPADLRQQCRVRLYTRTPELFLRDSGPLLIALPEDMQERVQAARRDARLVDRQGRSLSGEPLEPLAEEYARAVVKRASRTPQGLTRFGERFRDRHPRGGGLPGERAVRAVPIIYNLADALAGTAQDRSSFIEAYLPQIAPRFGTLVDWRELLTIEEWRAFPLESVLALLLQDSEGMSPGMREIQKAAERATILKHAMERKEVDAFRVQAILQTAPVSRLAVVAQEILQVRGLFEDQAVWGDVPARLLEVLRRLPGLPPDLAEVLVRSLVNEGRLRHPDLVSLAPQWIEHDVLLQALGVAALLELARALTTQQSLLKVFHFVDIHMTREPQPTADALISSGWWTAWRRMSALMAREGEEKRLAAEAWLKSRVWTGVGAREALWEDWRQVMDDLPTSLYEARRQAPWSVESELRRLWPWIPPFEEEQIFDLAGRAPDLASLAALADVLPKKDELNVGERIDRFVLQLSRFDSDFQSKEALGWILKEAPEGLQILNLEDSSKLYKRAGSRVSWALGARLASVLDCLEKDQMAKEAIWAADNPPLWDKPALAEALAFWMQRRGSVEKIGLEIAKKIEEQIAAVPSKRPPQVDRSLVTDLMRRGLEKCASLLNPDLIGVVVRENLVESAVIALAERAHNHPCWQELADQIERGPAERHLISQVAERVRKETGERRAALLRHGWATFEAAARNRAWLTKKPRDQNDLPVFELAASLTEPGGLGNAMLRVVFSADPNQKTTQEWWNALLRGFFDWRRYAFLECSEDRRDVAMALVVRLLAGSEEQQYFWNALKQSNEWDHWVTSR